MAFVSPSGDSSAVDAIAAKPEETSADKDHEPQSDVSQSGDGESWTCKDEAPSSTAKPDEPSAFERKLLSQNFTFDEGCGMLNEVQFGGSERLTSMRKLMQKTIGVNWFDADEDRPFDIAESRAGAAAAATFDDGETPDMPSTRSPSSDGMSKPSGGEADDEAEDRASVSSGAFCPEQGCTGDYEELKVQSSSDDVRVTNPFVSTCGFYGRDNKERLVKKRFRRHIKKDWFLDDDDDDDEEEEFIVGTECRERVQYQPDSPLLKSIHESLRRLEENDIEGDYESDGFASESHNRRKSRLRRYFPDPEAGRSSSGEDLSSSDDAHIKENFEVIDVKDYMPGFRASEESFKSFDEASSALLMCSPGMDECTEMLRHLNFDDFPMSEPLPAKKREPRLTRSHEDLGNKCALASFCGKFTLFRPKKTEPPTGSFTSRVKKVFTYPFRKNKKTDQPEEVGDGDAKPKKKKKGPMKILRKWKKRLHLSERIRSFIPEDSSLENQSVEIVMTESEDNLMTENDVTSMQETEVSLAIDRKRGGSGDPSRRSSSCPNTSSQARNLIHKPRSAVTMGFEFSNGQNPLVVETCGDVANRNQLSSASDVGINPRAFRLSHRSKSVPSRSIRVADTARDSVSDGSLSTAQQLRLYRGVGRPRAPRLTGERMRGGMDEFFGDEVPSDVEERVTAWPTCNAGNLRALTARVEFSSASVAGLDKASNSHSETKLLAGVRERLHSGANSKSGSPARQRFRRKSSHVPMEDRGLTHFVDWCSKNEGRAGESSPQEGRLFGAEEIKRDKGGCCHTADLACHRRGQGDDVLLLKKSEKDEPNFGLQMFDDFWDEMQDGSFDPMEITDNPHRHFIPLSQLHKRGFPLANSGESKEANHFEKESQAEIGQLANSSFGKGTIRALPSDQVMDETFVSDDFSYAATPVAKRGTRNGSYDKAVSNEKSLLSSVEGTDHQLRTSVLPSRERQLKRIKTADLEDISICELSSKIEKLRVQAQRTMTGINPDQAARRSHSVSNFQDFLKLTNTVSTSSLPRSASECSFLRMTPNQAKEKTVEDFNDLLRLLIDTLKEKERLENMPVVSMDSEGALKHEQEDSSVATQEISTDASSIRPPNTKACQTVGFPLNSSPVTPNKPKQMDAGTQTDSFPGSPGSAAPLTPSRTGDPVARRAQRMRTLREIERRRFRQYDQSYDGFWYPLSMLTVAIVLPLCGCIFRSRA